MDWLYWIGAAFALGLVEVLVLDVVVLMLIGGALVGAAAAALGAPVWVQFLAAGVSATGLVFLLRPWAVKLLGKNTGNLKLGVDALIGTRTKALTELTGHSGQVKLGGEVWSARLEDPTNGIHPPKPVPPGSELLVMGIDGATAVVFPVADFASSDLPAHTLRELE